MYNPIPAVLYLIGVMFFVHGNLIGGFIFITALFFFTLYYMAQ